MSLIRKLKQFRPVLVALFSTLTSLPVVLFLLSAALTSLAEKNPEVTERVYSTGIYPVLSGFFGRISGAFPVSLAEIVIVAMAVSTVAYITACIIKSVRQPENRGKIITGLLYSLACAISAIFLGFTLLCGFNYQRESFTVASGLSVRPSSADEVAALCAELAEKTGEYAKKINRDENGVMTSRFNSWYEAADTASGAYRAASLEYPVLGGYTPRPKPVFASKAMSLADLVGVYFPFTFEANVNTDVPAYVIPSAMLHELAHYKGFMREDEANFISYTACLAGGDDDFAYSGLMLALIHTMNALYSADRDAYWEVAQSLDDGIKRDFQANSEYWKQFEGPVAKVSGKVNDVYLKTNRQSAGVRSYGMMVDLLLAQYRKDHGLA